ncbi:MAG: hypothetical protein J07HQW2_00023, partial [Haloquadratum walsbyi J07HQW2]
SFTNQTDIFADETTLYDSLTPEELPERETELDDLHDALAPVARSASPYHTFVYGKTGQKKVGVTYKLEDLRSFVKDNYIIRYSCAKSDASYQVASNLIAELSTRSYYDTTKRQCLIFSARVYKRLVES